MARATDPDTAMIDEQLADHLKRARERDPLGKAALFSGSVPQSALGTLLLECSSCKRESPVRLRDLPGLMFPFSVTLPRKYHSYMRCPACGRRTWLRAQWRA